MTLTFLVLAITCLVLGIVFGKQLERRRAASLPAEGDTIGVMVASDSQIVALPNAIVRVVNRTPDGHIWQGSFYEESGGRLWHFMLRLPAR